METVLIRRLVALADLRSLEGYNDEAEVINDAVKVLQQPEQHSVIKHFEPVAWMSPDESLTRRGYSRFSSTCEGEWNIPLYTTPPQRTWVGLTDEELVELMRQVPHLTIGGLLAVEAKLKEKNT